MTYLHSCSLAREVMQQPVSGHRRASIDIGIGQVLGSDVLLMPLSVAELRFIDSVDKSDVPRGIPAHDEEEIETQIPELAMSRTRSCTKRGPLLVTDAHNVAEFSIFQSRCLIRGRFSTN
jgi:hypothetical protein